jgi:DNA-binding XRE family transcriptional regulator
MNKKYIGSSFKADVKEWEKSPTFKKAVEEHIEKRMAAKLVKGIRAKENLTQTELAKRAGVKQSAIARIEGGNPKALPRLDLLRDILHSVGYSMTLTAHKGTAKVQVSM